MFEKEAKLRAKDYTEDKERQIAYECGFLDGTDFAYNKANEWHFVKDGIFPTHSYRVLVYTDEGIGFGIYGLDNKKWYTYDTGFEVIAWKEIVFPKERKEND